MQHFFLFLIAKKKKEKRRKKSFSFQWQQNFENEEEGKIKNLRFLKKSSLSERSAEGKKSARN